jgi:hypothetical protein
MGAADAFTNRRNLAHRVRYALRHRSGSPPTPGGPRGTPGCG